MLKILIAVAIALTGFATAATAQTSPKQAQPKADKAAQTDGRVAQQTKMKQCNVDAKGKKGDERKKFMSECLKG
jgi:hypothetical protein